MKSKILPDYCISGRPLEKLDGVIVHYFSAKNVDLENQFDLEVCRNLFLDLNRAKIERQFYMHAEKWPAGRMYASAHLLIGRGGEAFVSKLDLDLVVELVRARAAPGREFENRRRIADGAGVERVRHAALLVPPEIRLVDRRHDFGVAVSVEIGHGDRAKADG